MGVTGRMLRLKGVSLENFISHSKSEVSFPDGVTTIVGENGAGKSSIVDAIYFALKVGARPRGSRLEDLVNIRHRSRGMRVVLDLEDDHRIIRVQIRKPSRGQVTYTMRVWDKLRNNVVEVANSQNEVRSRLEHYLGVSIDTVVRTSIIRQGELTKLLMGAAKERLEAIDKILGLDTYQKAYEKFRDLVQVSTADGATYRVTEKRAVEREADRVRSRIKELEARIKARRKEMGEKVVEKRRREAELKKLRNEREALRAEVEELRKKAEEVAAVRRQIEDREQKLRAIETELQEIREQREKIKRRESELAEYERLADALPVLSEASKLVKELRDHEEKLEQLTERLSEAEGLWATVMELASELRISPDEAEAELRAAEDRLQEMIERRQEAATSLENSRRQRRGLEAELANITKTIEEALKKVSSVTGQQFGSLAEAHEAVSKRVNDLDAEVEEISKALKAVAEEKAALTAKAEEVKRKIDMLKPGIMRCPLCGHDLSRERAEELRRGYSRDLENIRESLAELRRAEKDLGERKDRAKKERDRLLELERVLAVALPLEEQASNIKANITKLLDEEVAAESALNELSKRIASLKERIEKLSNLSKAVERLHWILGERPSEKVIEKMRAEAEEVKQGIVERRMSLTNALAKVYEILGREVGEDEVAELYSKAVSPETREAMQEIRRLKQRLTALEERENRLASESEEIRSELRGLKERLESLEGDLKALEKKETLLKEIEERVVEEEKAVSALDAEIRSLGDEVAEKERELEDLVERVEELGRVARKLGILGWIREEVLQRDKAPAMIREKARRAVETLLTEYLTRLGIEFDSIKVENDFSITLIRGGVESPLSSLSGGEKVALSIALLLALRRAVLGRAAGFLILDEPTIHLDEDRRERFVELLKEFRGGRIVRQLLVVTHDERVEDAADFVIRVIKSLGSDSVVRYLRPGEAIGEMA